MSYTFQELLNKLKQEEEVILLEVLNISSEDLVDRFEDVIESKMDFLFSEYELNEGEEEQ